MTDEDLTPEGELVQEFEFKPAVPPRVRTVAYFAAALGGLVVALAVGVIALWQPEYAWKALATGGLVNTFLGGVAGVFGVMYRPTALEP